MVVDLDEVLFDFVASFFAWHNRRYGTDLTLENLAGAKYLFDAWGGTSEEAVERIAAFFADVDVLGIEPIAGAVDCLQRLQSKYRLAVVSAKDPAYADITHAWIDTYFPGVFDRVILGIGHSERGEGSVTKATVCRELGASVMVDDQVAHLAPAAEHGIRTLVFGPYPWNQNQPLPPNATRVTGWPEVCAALG